MLPGNSLNSTSGDLVSSEIKHFHYHVQLLKYLQAIHLTCYEIEYLGRKISIIFKCIDNNLKKAFCIIHNERLRPFSLLHSIQGQTTDCLCFQLSEKYSYFLITAHQAFSFSISYVLWHLIKPFIMKYASIHVLVFFKKTF